MKHDVLKDYREGALWKTRTKLYGKTSRNLNSDDVPLEHVTIPPKETVLVLEIIKKTEFDHLKIFWDNKVIYLFNVDVGLDFYTNIEEQTDV